MITIRQEIITAIKYNSIFVLNFVFAKFKKMFTARFELQTKVRVVGWSEGAG